MTALEKGLQTGQVENVLLDNNLKNYERDLFTNSSFIISKEVEHPFSVGVALSGDAAKLSKRFRLYLKENQALVSRLAQSFRESPKGKNSKQNKTADTKVLV